MGILDETTITPGGESPDVSGQEEQGAVAGEQQQEDMSTQEPGDTDNSDDVDGDQHQDDEDDEEGSPDNAGQDNGLIAGKFKSMDDFVKAYRNLERQFTQERQAKGQPPATTPQQPQAPAPGQPQAAPDMNEKFWQALERNPIGTIQSIVNLAVRQQTAPIYEQRQNETFTQNFGKVAEQYPQLGTDEGMTAYIEKLSEIAEDVGRPELVRNPTPRMMRQAAEEAFGAQSKAEIYRTGKRAAQEENERTRPKQALGAPKAGSRKPADPPPMTPEDEIKAGIMKYARGGGLFG